MPLICGFGPGRRTLPMKTPKTPTEIKQDHIEYILAKYLKGQELWKVYFNGLSDEKLAKILKDIKEGE